MTNTVVVGAGGLIGSAVLQAVPHAQAFPVAVPWNDMEAVDRTFAQWAATTPLRNATVVWCAGRGSVGTSADDLAKETWSLQAFLSAALRTTGLVQRFVLVSSAGGVYGNAPDPHITESTIPSPVSDYGRAKLEQESLATVTCQNAGVPLIIARVSNVYGFGQDASKAQGLVSALVRASVTRQPASIFVPMDTRRDYISSHDVAEKIHRLIETPASDLDGVTIKIVASGMSTTVAELVAVVNRVRQRRTPIVFSTRRETSLQPRSLAFTSTVLTDVDKTPTTSLPVGVSQLAHHYLRGIVTRR